MSGYGRWVVRLEGCNGAGCGTAVTAQADVLPAPQVAPLQVSVAANPANPRVDEATELSAVISNAPEGETPSYNWEAGGDGEWQSYGSRSTLRFLADRPESWTFRVTVSYDSGASATSAPLTVTWTGGRARQEDGATGQQSNTATTLVSNTGQTTDRTNNFTSDHAQMFKTGTNADGYKLTSVTLRMASTATTAPTYTVTIHEERGPHPPRETTTNLLGTLMNPATLPSTAGEVVFNASGDGISLDANKFYWMVIDVSTGDGTTDVTSTTSKDEDSGTATGWSIIDSHNRRSNDSSSWHQASTDWVLQLAVRGTVTDATPPEFSSAVVADSTLRLTFNENLDTGSVPAPGDFHVTVGDNRRNVANGGVAIADATVTLTLESAVTATDTVKVRYTKPASNPLRDHAGNDVATFPDQDVTNNTPVLVSNTGQADDGTASFANDHAQEFRTGSNAEGYTLANVVLRLASSASTAPEFTVSIRSGAGFPDMTSDGNEGTLTTSGALPGTAGDVVFNATGDGIALEPNTRYWVVIDVSKGDGSTTTARTGSTAEDEGGAPGWAISDKRWWRGHSATTWEPETNNVLKLAIRGPLTYPAATADAGEDQTVQTGSTVTLLGSGSSTIANPAFTYQWTQTDGPTVNLSSATAQRPTFTAPPFRNDLVFSLVVNDGNEDSWPDTVTVAVRPPLNPASAPCKHPALELAPTPISTRLFEVTGITDNSISYRSTNVVHKIGQLHFCWPDGRVETPATAVDNTHTETVTGLDSGTTHWVSATNRLLGTARNAWQAVTTTGGASIVAARLTSSPAVGDSYLVGETIQARVTWSQPVTVSNGGSDDNLFLRLDLGDDDADQTNSRRKMSYVTGSGTDTLTFEYTVRAGDEDGDGVWLQTDGNAVVFRENGATSQGGNPATNNAVLTETGLPTTGDAEHKVDDGRPVTLVDIRGGCTPSDCTEAPRGYADGGPGEGEITINWMPGMPSSPATAGWTVSWRESGTSAFQHQDLDDTSARSHTFTGLDQTKTYDVQVRGRSASGSGDIARATGVRAVPTPPLLDSAAVDGAELTLTFSENLDTGSAPDGSAFTVSGGRTGAGTAAISGATATVTLDSAVNEGETVTVSYAPPASGSKLQDLVGNPAAAFTGQDVANNTGRDANSPENLRVEAANNLDAIVRWDAPTSLPDNHTLDGFIVEWTEVADGATASTVEKNAGDSQHYQTGLTEGSDYEVRVAANITDNSGNGSPVTSKAWSATTTVTAWQEKLQVWFDDGSPSLSAFNARIYYYANTNKINASAACSFEQIAGGTSSGSINCPPRTLVSNAYTTGAETVLRAKVTANLGGETSDQTISEVQQGGPAMPGQAATSGGNGNLVVGWADVPKASGTGDLDAVIVETRQQNSDSTWPGDWTQTIVPGNAETLASGTHVLEVANGTYQARVRARTDGDDDDANTTNVARLGRTSPIQEITVAAANINAAGAPTGVTVKGTGTERVVTWEPPSDADSGAVVSAYQVRHRLQGSSDPGR